LLLMAPSLLVLALFYLYPTLYTLYVSLTDLSLLSLRTGGRFVGLANYVELFTRGGLGFLLVNTLFWLTGLSVAARLLLGLAIGLLLDSRLVKAWRMSTLARLAIVLPWATPPIVAVAVWRLMLDPDIGVVNHVLVGLGFQPVAFLADTATVWPSLVTIIMWNTVPLVALSILASLQSIPAELYEAADLDGASRTQQLRFITLPYLRPTLAILTLMSTIWTFNNFVFVWLLTGAGPGTFTNVLATEVYMKAFVDLRLGYSAAIGVVMAAILGVIGWAWGGVVRRSGAVLAAA
jgi:multiple sugar transport system permease protein